MAFAGFVRDAITRLKSDRAVLYLVLARTWQGLAGPVTLLLIASRFTPVVQGFHYAFMSLIALRTFVELGTYVVIINVASHEWSKLSLAADGSIEGDEEASGRLISLGRLMFRWYSAMSVVFIVVIGAIGAWFLGSQPDAVHVHWLAPWWALVVLTGLQLVALSFISLLEGCNQVQQINRLRLSQAILGSLALWLTIALGGGLWAAVVNVAVMFGRDLYLLLIRYRRFFVPFFRAPEHRIDWRAEVWPMQWRIGAQGIVNYFMYSLFVPVVFHYHGPDQAGQMGMTWQVVTLIQTLALSPLLVLVPRMGMLAAKADWNELDRLWRRATAATMLLALLGNGAWLVVTSGIGRVIPTLAPRILPLAPTALLVLASLLVTLINCQAAYLRAHKREVLTAIGVGSSIVAGLLIWQFGARWSASGAAAAFLIVNLFINAPLVTAVWLRKRREWHAPLAAVPEAPAGGTYVHV